MSETPSRRIAGLYLALVLVFCALAGRPAQDNSVDALLERDDPKGEIYRRFQERFGTDEVLIMELRGAQLAPLLLSLSELHEALKEAPAIDRIISANALYASELELLSDQELGGLKNLTKMAWRFEGPLNRALGLFNPKEKRARIFVLSKPAPIPDRAKLSETLEHLRSRFKTKGINMTLAGSPLLNLELDRAGKQVERSALPLLVLAMIVLLLITTKSPRATALLLLPVGLVVAGTDGALNLAGEKNNLVVNIAKPLLLVLLLAGGVHIEVAFENAQREGLSRAEAAWAAAKRKRRPTLLALATTALGFLSLSAAEVAPIRVFGLLVAGGLVAGAPMLLLSLPLLLSHLGPRVSGQSQTPLLARAARTLVQAGLRAGLAGPLVAIVLIGVGAAQIFSLKADPHAIRYFSEDHPLRRDHEALAASGLGLQSVELMLTSEARVTEHLTLLALDQLARGADKLPGVRAVVGLPIFLREGNYRSNRTDAMPDAFFVESALKTERGIADFLTPDGKTVRLTLMISTLDAAQLDGLHQALARLAKAYTPKMQLQITGNYNLLLQAQRSMLDTLKWSLLITAILMELILIVALRSLRLGLIALVPNLLPVMINFILMRALSIPLDLGTSMTGAIALGIAVDDTLHFIMTWTKQGSLGASETTGRALMLSSVVIGAGFLVLLSSTFSPTGNFGLLCGVAMASALLADLMVLPVLLDRFGGPRFGPIYPANKQVGSDESAA